MVILWEASGSQSRGLLEHLAFLVDFPMKKTPFIDGFP